MTTAHRPTWNAALGGEAQGGNMAPQRTIKTMVRDLPQEMHMKMRTDLNKNNRPKSRAEMLEELERKERGEEAILNNGSSSTVSLAGAAASSSNFTSRSIGKQNGRFAALIKNDIDTNDNDDETGKSGISDSGPQLPIVSDENPFPEDSDMVFANSNRPGGPGSSSNANLNDDSDKDNNDDDSDSDESDYEALQLELAKIRQEREDEKKKKEEEEAEAKEMERKKQIDQANPLLNNSSSSGGNSSSSTALKRRWDEDTVFRNQARTAPEQKRRFINDNMRSDFHKRFLQKYVKN